ncbi:MAG TPA: type VI secretion system protein TssA [Polyangiaceae bacterium]|nr:type VI secretion system protein TssA [Polyangiaceae bacterium]
MEIAKLLAPITGDASAGPNLEYDPAFAALEKAAAGKPEQVIGGTTTAAEPPEWNQVLQGALELLGRTKDLRVGVLAARALLYRHGVVAFTEGIALVRGLVEQHWANVHPQLDPEDNNDPTMRITALSALASPTQMLALRAAALVDSRALGPVSMADLFPTTGAADAARISGAFEAAELAAIEATSAALAAAASDLRAIDTVFETQTGDRGPDFAVLLDYFNKGHLALTQRLALLKPATTPEGGAGAEPAAAAAAPPPRGLSGDILTREDVVKALDKICEYYARSEPASPVPLMAQRCKKLVTMSFFEMLTEIAPESVKQAQLVVGKGDGK